MLNITIQSLTQSTELAALQNDLLSLLASQRDLYLTRTSFESVQNTREGIMLHALNHIIKYVHRLFIKTVYKYLA